MTNSERGLREFERHLENHMRKPNPNCSHCTATAELLGAIFGKKRSLELMGVTK